VEHFIQLRTSRQTPINIGQLENPIRKSSQLDRSTSAAACYLDTTTTPSKTFVLPPMVLDNGIGRLSGSAIQYRPLPLSEKNYSFATAQLGLRPRITIFVAAPMDFAAVSQACVLFPTHDMNDNDGMLMSTPPFKFAPVHPREPIELTLGGRDSSRPENGRSTAHYRDFAPWRVLRRFAVTDKHTRPNKYSARPEASRMIPAGFPFNKHSESV
jgi:hypothetical protein